MGIGTYELNTDMDFNCLIKSMQPTGGVAATVTVTIPEGYTVEQIIQLLAENAPFFHLELTYEGDVLVKAVLDGEELL